MTIDVKARVRRANLLTRGDQLDQLFDDDLSTRLLRDIYAKKEGRMSDTTDRPQSAATIEGKGGDGLPAATKPPRRQGPAWALVGFVAVLAMGVVLALVAREPEPVADTTPVGIAEAFFDARNAHDVEAMTALLAEDADFQEVMLESLDDVPVAVEFERIAGFTYDVNGCTEENPLLVHCAYRLSNDVSRALGIVQGEGAFFVITIADGKITNVNNHERAANLGNEVFWHNFDPWLEENHPEDAAKIPEELNPESLAIIEQYLPEYLASVESSG